MARVFPLPNRLDIAYKLRENYWQGISNVELEIVGVRLAQTTNNKSNKKAIFNYQGRTYACSLSSSINELRIRNEQGKVLAVCPGSKEGLLGTTRDNAQKIDVTKPPFEQLVKIALGTLREKSII